MADIDGRVVELAASQEGMIRREHLIALGATSKVIARMRRVGVLRQVTTDTFALGGVPLTAGRRERVALWQAGSLGALSHASAAARWTFPRVGPGATEVVVPHGTTVPRSTVGRVHVSRRLPATDIVVLDGWRVTSPERTVIDMAARLGPRHLEECLLDLRRRHLVDVDAFHRRLGGDLRRRVPGMSRVDRIVARLTARPPGESWLEDRFIEVLADAGRPLPETQVWIVIDGHRYRVDNLWTAERLVVELDGHEFHSTRPDRRADAERRARLTGARYDVVVFTYDDVVDRPEYVLGVVDHHLAVRRAA